MYQEERIYQILQWLRDRQKLSNREIMDRFQISRDTARRDIVRLVEEGVAVRTHGGVLLPEALGEVKSYRSRAPVNQRVKRALAARAAGYLNQNQLCFFDTSTTVEELCDLIPPSTTVYTNSLANLERLTHQQSNVHMLGGKLHKKHRYLYGGETLEQLETIRFDMAFLGVAAIHADGIYVEDREDAYVKLRAIRQSTFAFLLADDSKFLKTSRYKVCSFDAINALITNRTPPQELAEQMRLGKMALDVIQQSE